MLPTPPPQMSAQNNPDRLTRPRFDPSVLPKYIHYKMNLHEWFTELQVELNLFGEELVYATIPKYCFVESSIVSAWFSGLDVATQTFITKGRDCWEGMKTVMSRQWALLLWLAIRQAESRKKRHEETFLEFFYLKINLLKNAYPQCGPEEYIEMVKATLNDSRVELWTRETHDLARFAIELQEYDDHLARYPRKAFVPKASSIFPSNTRSSYVSPELSVISRGESTVKGGNVGAEKPRRSNNEIVAINRKRVESLQKQKDDSGRIVDSFIKENGSIGFLRNLCSICAKAESPD